MCTYVTYREPVEGSAKGPQGNWFSVTDAVVYFDHPVHAMAEHTLNVDLVDPSAGPGARVAVELTADSACRLVEAIQAALSATSHDAVWTTRAPGAFGQKAYGDESTVDEINWEGWRYTIHSHPGERIAPHSS